MSFMAARSAKRANVAQLNPHLKAQELKQVSFVGVGVVHPPGAVAWGGLLAVRGPSGLHSQMARRLCTGMQLSLTLGSWQIIADSGPFEVGSYMSV